MNYRVKFDGSFDYKTAEKTKEALSLVVQGNIFRNDHFTIEEDGIRLRIYFSTLIPSPCWEDCIIPLHQISEFAQAGNVACSYEGAPDLYIKAKGKG